MKSGALKILPVVAGLAAVVLAARWMASDSLTRGMVVRAPGADQKTAIPVKITDLTGELITGEGKPSALPGAWPGFRGARLDNIAQETGLDPSAWGKAGPRREWMVDTGEGYAGAAVRNGRVYLLDYDQKQQADLLRCLSLDDGKMIWERRYPVDVKRNHGMSRTVPAVTDEAVITLGPKCHVSCADARTGAFKWGIDLVAQYKTKVPPWYAGQCPLVEDGRVILAPGGDALLIAVELSTGKVLWKSPNPHKWEMTHSSITPILFHQKKMYIYCGSGGVAGISGDDGAILWETTKWKVPLATVPAPVAVGEGRILLSGGYGAGSMLLQLKETDGSISPEIVKQMPPEVFGSEQQTPIFYEGFLYGVIPGGQLVCVDLESGKQRWNSGNQHFGLGAYTLNAGRIFVLNDSGALTVARATPDGFQPAGKWTIIAEAHDSWGPMAIAGGRLLARDLRRLVCLNLREVGHE